MNRTLYLLCLASLFACTSVREFIPSGLSARFTVEPMLQNLMMINGVPAEPELWPASVYARVGVGGACSATLVGQRVVLIASHCVTNGGRISFTAQANNYQATCDQHPEYSHHGGNITADWALCLVERPVTGVVFESIGVTEKIAIGQSVALSGYGCVTPGGGGGNDGIFRVGVANIEGLPTATDFDVVTKGGAALCFGDSGGAAYLIDHERRVIFGVNSRGDINSMSYLPWVGAPQFVTWANAWARSANNVRICGIHTDALYCRNTGITAPVIQVPTGKRVMPSVPVKRRIKIRS